MAHLCRYANHPLAFIAHYVSRRAAGHVTIVATVIGAVTCSVAAQYAVKILWTF
jgi:ATP-binding cassette subfamily B protein